MARGYFLIGTDFAAPAKGKLRGSRFVVRFWKGKKKFFGFSCTETSSEHGTRFLKEGSGLSSNRTGRGVSLQEKSLEMSRECAATVWQAIRACSLGNPLGCTHAGGERKEPVLQEEDRQRRGKLGRSMSGMLH